MNEFFITSGSLIAVLLSVVAFFLHRVINDVKRCVEITSENKARIDLIEQQQKNDVKRIEERTQLELQQLTRTVNHLSKNVHELILKISER
jgi:uncharacterized protein YybS (DUF2232 family)